MIVSFTNQKGGVGKSTTAVHFAYWLKTKKRNISVTLVDSDEQQSAVTWLKAMEGVDIPVSTLLTTNEIIERLPNLADEFDVVVVDAPASAQEVARAVLLVADLAVIPIQPSAIDIHSSTETFRLVAQAQKVRGGQPNAAAFISRAIKGTKLKNEAIAFLKVTPGITPLKHIIHQRVGVADTFGQYATVWDLPGTKDSQEEYEKLFVEIWRLMK